MIVTDTSCRTVVDNGSTIYSAGARWSKKLMAVLFVISISMVSATSQEKSAGAKFDGPAELPRVLVSSALADTPALGKAHLVKAADRLQDALNEANCGDTVQLEAGATFTGVFTLPAKTCDDKHWIIVRTSAPDSELPAEGTRITPCYAGVPAIFPARPAFQCDAKASVMPRLMYDGQGGSGPLVLADGANHYRLVEPRGNAHDSGGNHL